MSCCHRGAKLSVQAFVCRLGPGSLVLASPVKRQTRFTVSESPSGWVVVRVDLERTCDLSVLAVGLDDGCARWIDRDVWGWLDELYDLEAFDPLPWSDFGSLGTRSEAVR